MLVELTSSVFVLAAERPNVYSSRPIKTTRSGRSDMSADKDNHAAPPEPDSNTAENL